MFTAKELDMLIHQLFLHASPVVANQFDHLYSMVPETLHHL